MFGERDSGSTATQRVYLQRKMRISIGKKKAFTEAVRKNSYTLCSPGAVQHALRLYAVLRCQLGASATHILYVTIRTPVLCPRLSSSPRTDSYSPEDCAHPFLLLTRSLLASEMQWCSPLCQSTAHLLLLCLVGIEPPAKLPCSRVCCRTALGTRKALPCCHRRCWPTARAPADSTVSTWMRRRRES